MANANSPARLALRLIYEDEHLVQIEAHLAAGAWAGASTAYTTLDQLLSSAVELETFARRLSGDFSLVAGADNGTGLITLRFHPLDRARHIGCAVTFATATASNTPETSTRLHIELKTEAAALDRFVSELRDLAKRQRRDATLDVAAA